jgi:hypothetical protein
MGHDLFEMKENSKSKSKIFAFGTVVGIVKYVQVEGRTPRRSQRAESELVARGLWNIVERTANQR